MITCPLSEVGFGGARGGGKTDGVLGKYAIKAEQYGRYFNAVFFRREMPQADDLIERAKEIYLKLGAYWQEQKKQFIFRGGGRIRFRPLESLQDAEKYQGQNITDAAIEEAGNYPDPGPIDRLFGCLRSVGGVPIQLITTFNPGGPGHGWLKRRYVPPDARLGMKILERELPNGKKHRYIYIPSKVQNNQILLQQDPGYIDRLHLVGSPELVRAWLEGDFEIHEGTYFPEFGTRHILEPFPIPKHWNRYLGFDWGYHSPYCVLWGAISSGKDDNGNEVPYPKGAVIIYRELTGKGQDNTDIAKRIVELSKGEDPLMVADPSIFNTQGGPSIADQFRGEGVVFRPADNERITGWNEIRRRLKPSPAYLYITTNCNYLLESLPSLPMDSKHPEDVDTQADDHACLSGDTLVDTTKGQKRIKELEGTTGYIYNVNGQPVPYAIAAKTGLNRKVLRLELDDGRIIRATPDHKFLINNKWHELSTIRPQMQIQCVTYESECNYRDVSGVQRQKVLSLWQLLQLSIEKVKGVTQATSRSMEALLWPNPRWARYTSYRWQSAQQSDYKLRSIKTWPTFQKTYDFRKERKESGSHKDRQRKSEGMAQVRGRQGMAQNTCKEDSSINPVNRTNMSSVWQDIPNQETYEEQEQILPSELQNDSPTATVKSIRDDGIEDVYCLYVPKGNAFTIEGGIITHNCDALRYLCKAKTFQTDYTAPKENAKMGGRVLVSEYIQQVRRERDRPRV